MRSRVSDPLPTAAVINRRNPQQRSLRKPRWLSAVLVLLAVVVLAACGSGSSDNGAAGNQRGDNGAEAAGDGDGAEVPEMTGEDGWADLHDMDIPEPGTAVLTIDGATYEVDDIECDGDGVESEMGLFQIRATGTFETDDGRTGHLEIHRFVDTGREDFYDYGGQDSASVYVSVNEPGKQPEEVQNYTSDRDVPGEIDRTGESLPLVHAQPDGSFTVDSDLEPSLAQWKDDALHGPVTIAGKCAAPW